jgi:hypothetical protein
MMPSSVGKSVAERSGLSRARRADPHLFSEFQTTAGLLPYMPRFVEHIEYLTGHQHGCRIRKMLIQPLDLMRSESLVLRFWECLAGISIVSTCGSR